MFDVSRDFQTAFEKTRKNAWALLAVLFVGFGLYEHWTDPTDTTNLFAKIQAEIDNQYPAALQSSYMQNFVEKLARTACYLPGIFLSTHDLATPAILIFIGVFYFYWPLITHICLGLVFWLYAALGDEKNKNRIQERTMLFVAMLVVAYFVR